jgi:hypothetical protein
MNSFVVEMAKGDNGNTLNEVFCMMLMMHNMMAEAHKSGMAHGVAVAVYILDLTNIAQFAARTSVHLPPTYESDKRSTQIGIQDAWYPASLTFYCRAEKKVKCAF